MMEETVPTLVALTVFVADTGSVVPEPLMHSEFLLTGGAQSTMMSRLFTEGLISIVPESIDQSP